MNAATLVVGGVLYDPRKVRVLLTRRKNPPKLLGTNMVDGPRWQLPGGKVERDESPLAALCRELFEELSLDAVGGPWGPKLIPCAVENQWEDGSATILIAYFGLIPERGWKLKDPACDAADWFAIEQLSSLLMMPGNRRLIMAALT